MMITNPPWPPVDRPSSPLPSFPLLVIEGWQPGRRGGGYTKGGQGQGAECTARGRGSAGYGDQYHVNSLAFRCPSLSNQYDRVARRFQSLEQLVDQAESSQSTPKTEFIFSTPRPITNKTQLLIMSSFFGGGSSAATAAGASDMLAKKEEMKQRIAQELAIANAQQLINVSS